jgi:predicted GIY-YIG superfamily endonuclease
MPYDWCVYAIENHVNEKKYIGITTKILANRLDEHYQDYLNGKRTKNGRLPPLHAAFRKYGVDKFIIYELETCENLDEAQLKEEQYIVQLRTYAGHPIRGGYNLSYGGEQPDWDPHDR